MFYNLASGFRERQDLTVLREERIRMLSGQAVAQARNR